MKKLITIMAIMIVLAGTLFAIDNASLTITLTISEYAPTFKLATSDSTYISTAGSDLVENGGSVSAGSATANAAAGKKLADGESLTVRFAILQVNNAIGYIKTTHKYSFTASATDLVNTSDSSHKFSTSGTITYSSADYISDTYATVTDGSSFSVEYNGATYTPAATEAEIATFDVTWNANEAAISGDYTATVSLTMTTI